MLYTIHQINVIKYVISYYYNLKVVIINTIVFFNIYICHNTCYSDNNILVPITYLLNDNSVISITKSIYYFYTSTSIS